MEIVKIPNMLMKIC